METFPYGLGWKPGIHSLLSLLAVAGSGSICFQNQLLSILGSGGDSASHPGAQLPLAQ
jgi:hypothetical protein